MLSNKKLQGAIDEIKEISRLESALFSPKLTLVASTFDVEDKINEYVSDFIESEANKETIGKYLLFKVVVDQDVKYIMVTVISDDMSYVLANMAMCQIRTLAASYEETHDKNNFMQNILLGNMLTVDIFSKAKKLHIEECNRLVFVIDTGNKNADTVIELVKNMADIRLGDCVTSIDPHSVVLIKSFSNVKESEFESSAKEIANSLVDTLESEAMINVRVGYGNVISTLTQITESYQEAKLALEVGRVFYAELKTVSYGKLGLGRLIYQLPKSLCEMYVREVFGEEIPEILDDEESMTTISMFFDNNLNISETARQLFVHRNTLVYRLERIQKSIGLDIRTFEDAMTFRIAVMVIAHLKDIKGGN